MGNKPLAPKALQKKENGGSAMTIDRPLVGKTAFVSGSGQNIGRAVALRLAQMGCHVVVNGSTRSDDCGNRDPHPRHRH